MLVKLHIKAHAAHARLVQPLQDDNAQVGLFRAAFKTHETVILARDACSRASWARPPTTVLLRLCVWLCGVAVG